MKNPIKILILCPINDTTKIVNKKVFRVRFKKFRGLTCLIFSLPPLVDASRLNAKSEENEGINLIKNKIITSNATLKRAIIKFDKITFLLSTNFSIITLGKMPKQDKPIKNEKRIHEITPTIREDAFIFLTF